MNFERNIKTIIIVLVIVIIAFSLIWFFYLKDTREDMLVKEAIVLVEQIENFRKENGYLPESLNDINYSGKTGADELFYTKFSEKNYTVSFVMSFDYNKIYYSDTKNWENGFREMK